MKSNRAFTLIEVMVVLSILAIIAILAYNFFGSTMKEAKLSQAATKSYKEMGAIGAAYEKYYLDNGVEPDSGSPANARADLLNGGYLKSWPSADQTLKGSGCVAGSVTYEMYSDWDDFRDADGVGNTEWDDPAVSLGPVGLEVCLAVQERYSNLGGTQAWDYSKSNGEASVYPPMSNWQAYCYDFDSGASGCYYILYNLGVQGND